MRCKICGSQNYDGAIDDYGDYICMRDHFLNILSAWVNYKEIKNVITCRL